VRQPPRQGEGRLTNAETLPLPGAPEITVALRRSPRARRMSLRVSRLDGRVTLSLPAAVPATEAAAFLADKAGWVRRHLEGRPPEIRPAPGARVPLEGRLVPVVSDAVPGLDARRIAVDPARPAPPQVAALLKAAARDRLGQASDRHAARIGRRYTALALRDTRSRWGSCSSAGRLMFSWRLVMAPPAVLDYVAAHEVAHLRHMNHGPAFWRLVGRLCPDYEAHRAWLRHQGATLHAVRFAP